MKQATIKSTTVFAQVHVDIQENSMAHDWYLFQVNIWALTSYEISSKGKNLLSWKYIVNVVWETTSHKGVVLY